MKVRVGMPINDAKPFLRWAGSKRKVIAELIKYWDENYNKYFEPFMGSAQLFFAANPVNAILSDINKELIDTYQIVKAQPRELFKTLSEFPKNKKYYYSLRKKDLNSLTKVERAARFIYLNRYCFNGLYRTNLNGIFNVPYSDQKTGYLPSLKHLLQVSKSLKKVKIIRGDFETILLDNVNENDFVYLDPPYALKNRRIFNQYGPQSFGLKDIKRLNELLKIIDQRKAKFLLSYAYSREALSSFGEWEYRKIFIQRNIAGFTKHRRKAAELLFTNIGSLN